MARVQAKWLRLGGSGGAAARPGRPQWEPRRLAHAPSQLAMYYRIRGGNKVDRWHAGELSPIAFSYWRQDGF